MDRVQQICRLLMPIMVTTMFVYETLLEDEDSSDDEFSSDNLEKIVGYAEYTIPRLTISQFREHFRMVPATFEHLLERLSLNLMDINLPLTVGRPMAEASKQLLIGIWILANRESFRSVAERFGVAKSTAWGCCNRVCAALLQLNKDYGIISWPSAARRKAICSGFRANGGLPGAYGAIDGSHMHIPAPKDNHISYINRKGFHSILLQGVCDHEMLFTDCYAGEVGSIHDALMYKRSDLYGRIESGAAPLDADQHLIGDSAYPLSQSLMVPFRDNGRLTNEQKQFNKKLSRSRSVIERAYGLLKARFRRLFYLDMRRVDQIPLFIIACCILHNICLKECDWEWLNDEVIDDVDVDSEGSESDDEGDGNGRNIPNIQNRPAGVAKRLALVAMVNRRRAQ